MIGLTAETADPAGGVIRRKEGSRSQRLHRGGGLVWIDSEDFKFVGPAGMMVLAKAGAELWASFGYTTAQEGRSVTGVSKVLKAVAEDSNLSQLKSLADEVQALATIERFRLRFGSPLEASVVAPDEGLRPDRLVTTQLR